MSHTSEKKLVLVAAWGFVLTGLLLISQKTLRAEDSEKAKCPAGRCEVRVEVRGNVPLLEGLPFVKYFNFPQVEDKACAKAAEDSFERIGVDFDVLPGHLVTYLQNGECQVICKDDGCPACEASNACAVANATCAKSGCPTEKCEGCQDVDVLVSNPHAKLMLQCAGLEQVFPGAQPTFEQLITLQVENAVMEASHEAQESIHEARCELFGELLELSKENAKLEARVEYLRERDEIREKMVELIAENSKLKAAAELSEERHAMHKQTLQVALENERLKSRITELEQRESASPKVARTAKKPKTARKAELK